MRSGIVYRIEYKEDPNIRYIGSTLQELKYRWRDHKMAYKGWLKNKERGVAIYPYFEKHGLENVSITTIKKYAVVDKEHLRVYETLWFNKLENININSPFNPIPKKIIDKNPTKRAPSQSHSKHREEPVGHAGKVRVNTTKKTTKTTQNFVAFAGGGQSGPVTWNFLSMGKPRICVLQRGPNLCLCRTGHGCLFHTRPLQKSGIPTEPDL